MRCSRIDLIKVVKPPVLLLETSVIVESKARTHAEIRTDLKLVLDVFARFVGAVVAVGVALQIG